MAHVRQQIREAIANAITGLLTTGDNVYQSRVYPHTSLPCLSVYTKEEEAEIDSINSPRSSRRELSIAIEIRAQQTSDVDDKIDDISAEVEEVLGADSTVSGLAKDIRYDGVIIEFEDGGQQPTALATMNYTVIYRVLENNAQQPE